MTAQQDTIENRNGQASVPLTFALRVKAYRAILSGLIRADAGVGQKCRARRVSAGNGLYLVVYAVTRRKNCR